MGLHAIKTEVQTGYHFRRQSSSPTGTNGERNRSGKYLLDAIHSEINGVEEERQRQHQVKMDTGAPRSVMETKQLT